tara:strand:+ start:709 stop:1758 length:1050 start_codon:yes stop_codon:yes gene_type:complete
MKPKIFIGSSTEQLDIAYIIQENLEYDAHTTVWTQGIFKLSSNALDSLLKSLNDFDFAIFVFHPDDITQIRNESFETVRDNLIFELGLFIGKLGKEKVFFLVPRTIQKLHLPTDLLGVTPGTYDNIREDNNLQASLGPFCNQVRKELKNFIYENLEDIHDEPSYIKKIAIEKSSHWEFLFASALLKSRLSSINETYAEIDKGLIIQRAKYLDGIGFFEWIKITLTDFENFVKLFELCANDLVEAFGESGVAGKPIEIKNSVDRFIQLCRELVNWEFELNSLKVPDDLKIIKTKIKGATKSLVINELNSLQKELQKVSDEKLTKVRLTFTPKLPDEFNTVVNDFNSYFGI